MPCLPVESASPIWVSRPSPSRYFITGGDRITVKGVIAEPTRVRRLEWETSAGDRGALTPAANWKLEGLALHPGTNLITIIAWLSGGTATDASLTVVRTTGGSTPLRARGPVEWLGQLVDYEESDGMALIFGDIAVGTIEQIDRRSKKQARREALTTTRPGGLRRICVAALLSFR